jgi:hypothetical protein
MNNLFNTLPDFLKSKIILYYLGFGTPTSIIFKSIIQNSKVIKIDGLTCAQLFTINHGAVRCRGTTDSATSANALHELELIRTQIINAFF